MLPLIVHSFYVLRVYLFMQGTFSLWDLNYNFIYLLGYVSFAKYIWLLSWEKGKKAKKVGKIFPLLIVCFPNMVDRWLLASPALCKWIAVDDLNQEWAIE